MHKVIRPDVVRPLGPKPKTRTVVQPQTLALWLFHGNGCAASAITGGKCAQAAVTAAFASLYSGDAPKLGGLLGKAFARVGRFFVDNIADATPTHTAVFPRGAGSSVGLMPEGYEMVSRWVGKAEAWMQNGGTAVPADIGNGGRVYVSKWGADKPGGTGDFRIDFGIHEKVLQTAANENWRQITQPVQSLPVHNLQISVPKGNVP